MFSNQPNIEPAAAEILQRRTYADPGTSILIGVSGIDGSGKGYVTDRIVEHLRKSGTRAVGLHADGWLNLPRKRFNTDDPGRHFYENALRLEDMFEKWVLPLKRQRSHSGVMDFAEETAKAYRKHAYEFEDVDVIVLECIFLFKRLCRRHLDLAIWIECSFEIALERAIARGQEGLPVSETIRAYETIYFPAQRIHLCQDCPRETADLIINNGQ